MYLKIKNLLKIQIGDEEKIRLLLEQERETNVNQIAKDGSTALYAAARSGHLNVVKLLIEKGAKVDIAKNDGATALFIASQVKTYYAS